MQSAAMLVRREAAAEVGYLDPEFFVYSDETDFQKRLHDAGWRVLFVPGAEAVHHEQLTNDRVAGRRRLVEFHRNRDLYMRKHHGAASAGGGSRAHRVDLCRAGVASLVLPGQGRRLVLASCAPGAEPEGRGDPRGGRRAERKARPRRAERVVSAPTSEVLAAWELERLMQKAAATRFERTPYGFVCANSELTSVWSASRVQVEPDGEVADARPDARDDRASLAVASPSCATGRR